MRRASLAIFVLTLAAIPVFADGPETGVVTGTVTEPGGAPLPGIDVKLVGERGEKLTQTADDGTFRFALLVPGSYTVKVEIEGLGRSEQTVQVTAGERSDVVLALKLETAETIVATAELRSSTGSTSPPAPPSPPRSALGRPGRPAPTTASSTCCRG
jgi:hypothetical protein